MLNKNHEKTVKKIARLEESHECAGLDDNQQDSHYGPRGVERLRRLMIIPSNANCTLAVL